MADLEKKIVVPVEADTSSADKKIDKFRKNASNEEIKLSVDVDLSTINRLLGEIKSLTNDISKAFDKDFKFSGLQKGLDGVLDKLEKTTRYFNKNKPNEIQVFKVDVVGLSSLIDATKDIKDNIKSLNDNKINLESFDNLASVLSNIDATLNSINTGLGLEKIRPSKMIKKDIEETSNSLNGLAKAQKKIQDVEKNLNRGVAKKTFASFFEFGDLKDIDTGKFEKYLDYLRDYVKLGGDLSKIKIGKFSSNVDLTKIEALKDLNDKDFNKIHTFYEKEDVRTLQDVYDLLVLIKAIDTEIFTDNSKITSDIANTAPEVDRLTTSLKDLNKELDKALIRENRDLNVSLDTKSIDSFADAVKEAVQAISNLNVNIPENFSFDGLSVESLEKIIGKLDEIVSTIKNIGTLLSTGIDTSNLHVKELEIDVDPKVDVDEFIDKIEKQIQGSGKKVKILADVDLENVTDNTDKDSELVDKEVIDGLKPAFKEVSDDFGKNLKLEISDISNNLKNVLSNIEYNSLFEDLRRSLLNIVDQFQNSLNNVTFSGEQTNEIYNVLKQWNDASKTLLKTGNKDSERAALLNRVNGNISNSYLFDKEGSFSGKLLNELNKLETGVSGKIGEIYDTWLHSHPFQNAVEDLKAIGSNIGFSPDDIEVYRNKYLRQGVTNMMVANNGKFANINWDGISEEIINKVIKSFRTSDIFKNGQFRGNKVIDNNTYDFDKQSVLMNNAIIQAMKSAGIQDAESRFTVGNIDDLKVDLSNVHKEEKKLSEETKVLIDTFQKLSNLLDSINNESFTFGISEESLDGILIKLNEIVEAIKNIGTLSNNLDLDTNINSDNNSAKPHGDRVTGLGFHGTKVKWDSDNFDFSKAKAAQLGAGMYLTDDIENVANFGKAQIKQVEVDLSKCFVLTDDYISSIADVYKSMGQEIPTVEKTSKEVLADIRAFNKTSKENSDSFRQNMMELGYQGMYVGDHLSNKKIKSELVIYDEKSLKGLSSTTKEDLLNLKNTIGFNEFNVQLNSAEKVLKTYQDLANYLSKQGNTKTFISSLVSGLQEADNELRTILEDLNLIDKETGKINFNGITGGNTNNGGIISDNVTLIGRDEKYLEKTKDLIPRLQEAKKLGANVGVILDVLQTDASKLFYELQETMSGDAIQMTFPGNHKEFNEFLNATDEQILKLISDLKILSDTGLYIDLNGDNILYDKEQGFNFIDLASREGNFKTNDPSRLLEILEKHYGSEYKNQFDVFKNRFTDLLQKSDNDDDFVTKTHVKPDVDANSFASEVESQLKESGKKVQIDIEPKVEISKFISDVENKLKESGEKVRIDIEPSEESLNELSNKVKESISSLSDNNNENDDLNTTNNSIKTEENIVSDVVVSEVQDLNSLKEKIDTVTDAVDLKTRAFQEEEQVVVGTVQREITNLEALNGCILDIVESIDKLKNVSFNLDLNLLESEDIESLDENVSNILSTLKSNLNEKLKEIDIESLSKLSEALSGLKTTNKTAENLELVAVALQEFKTSISDFSLESNSFLSAINTLLSKSSELKDLSNILDKGQRKFVQAAETIENVSNNSTDKSESKKDSKTNQKKKTQKKEKDKTSFANETYFKDINKDKEGVMSLKDAYEKLIDTKEEYISLESKDKNNTATDNEIAKLKELTEQRKIAQDTINKYANSDGDALKFTSAIDKALGKMKELKYSGSGKVFENVFSKASQKIEQFSLKLANGEISLEKYNKTVEKIQANIKNNKTIDFIDEENIEKAKEAMHKYAIEASNGMAKLNESKSSVDKLTFEWEDQNGVIQRLTMNYDELTGALSKVQKPLNNAGKGAKTLSERLKQGWLNVGQYAASFMSFYEILNLLKNGVQVIRDLDTALTEMRKVSDESVESLKNFQKVSFDIAESVGSTAQQIQNSTADWIRLGESLKEASKSAEVSNILLNVSEFESIDAATESLVAMSSAYNELDKMEIIDKLNNIGNNFSISTDGLATALQKSASALKTAGNDMDEAVALVTAGNAVVQDADSVGEGLRTIALRITGTESAKEELESLGEDTSDFIVQTSAKSQQAIKDFTRVAKNNFEGFDILDENGNFKSTYEILLGISEIYEEIVATDKQYGSNMANGLLETLAGKNRANIAASILQNSEILQSVYESSQDSSGSALRENERYLDSIDGRIQLFQNRLQEFWYNLIDSDVVKEIVDAGTELINILDNVLKGFNESGAANVIVKFFTGIINSISSLTDKLGNFNIVWAGFLGKKIFDSFKEGKEGKSSGGRVKKFTLIAKYATESFSREVCEFWCISECQYMLNVSKKNILLFRCTQV